jgi:dTDP-4-dehydrorhamnose 3,5-epimerase
MIRKFGGQSMIEGVAITPLQVISMQAGNVMHGMKKDDIGFSGFGEAYFSLINSGAIKGWKRHREMVCNFIVPNGKIKVVIFDDKTGLFDEFILSPQNYFRLTIPPNFWVAFQGIDEVASLLLNVASVRHDPTEVDNKELDKIRYNWRIIK